MLYTCTSDMKDCFLGSLGSLGFSFSDPAQNTSLLYRIPSHWRVASSFVGFSPSHKIFGHLGQHRFERNRSVGYFRFPSVGRSLNTNFSPGLGLATISLLALVPTSNHHVPAVGVAVACGLRRSLLLFPVGRSSRCWSHCRPELPSGSVRAAIARRSSSWKSRFSQNL